MLQTGMFSKFILPALLICATAAKGRQTTRIEHANASFTEVYYVLKSDKKVKHGPYRLVQRFITSASLASVSPEGFNRDSLRINSENRYIVEGEFRNDKMEGVWTKKIGDTIMLRGSYSSGLKDGVWTQFGRTGLSSYIVDSGAYSRNKRIGKWVHYHHPDSGKGFLFSHVEFSEDGEPIGEWTYYASDGTVNRRYNYTTRRVLVSPADSIVYQIIDGRDTLRTMVDHSPYYPGGMLLFRRKLAEQLIVSSKKNHGENIISKSMVQFFVNGDGVMESISLIRPSANNSLNHAALRAVNLLNTVKWFPASYERRIVKCRVIVPLSFIVEPPSREEIIRDYVRKNARETYPGAKVYIGKPQLLEPMVRLIL